MQVRKQTIRSVGLIGLGYWGKNILRNLAEMQVLRVACDASREIRSSFELTYPDVTFTGDPGQMLEDPDVTGIAIATPASTHAMLVERALKAGKDVFVEKPLALTVREGESLVRLAAEEKRILMVGHILQYHPAIRKLKSLITDGVLGDLQYMYSNRLNIGKLRTEESILWSFAPHDISVILSLVGKEPLTVTASGGAYINDGVADTSTTLLEFSDGVKAHIFVSWLHPFKEQKLVVVGSKAMAVFDDLSAEKLLLYKHVIERKPGLNPVARKADNEVIPIDAAEPLRAELDQFVASMQSRVAPPSDGEEGLRVLRVLERADATLGGGSMTTRTDQQNYFVHETARVDDRVEIGDGTKVWHYSHIQSGARIGNKCVLGQNVNVGNNVSIGNSVKIQNNVSIYEGVTIEDYVFCGPSMVFTNILNPRSKYPQVGSEFYIKTLVREGASLGANCTIVCGNTIGRFAFVGAGAVVTKDVPDFALVVGSPAKVIGWMSEAGHKLEFDETGAARCPRSGKRYRLIDEAVKEEPDA